MSHTRTVLGAPLGAEEHDHNRHNTRKAGRRDTEQVTTQRGRSKSRIFQIAGLAAALTGIGFAGGLDVGRREGSREVPANVTPSPDAGSPEVPSLEQQSQQLLLFLGGYFQTFPDRNNPTVPYEVETPEQKIAAREFLIKNFSLEDQFSGINAQNFIINRPNTESDSAIDKNGKLQCTFESTEAGKIFFTIDLANGEVKKADKGPVHKASQKPAKTTVDTEFEGKTRAELEGEADQLERELRHTPTPIRPAYNPNNMSESDREAQKRADAESRALGEKMSRLDRIRAWLNRSQ